MKEFIISVGYRVNSKRATNFRIWATKVLKEYMTKGFALDDERLKQGKRLLRKTIISLDKPEQLFYSNNRTNVLVFLFGRVAARGGAFGEAEQRPDRAGGAGWNTCLPAGKCR